MGKPIRNVNAECDICFFVSNGNVFRIGLREEYVLGVKRLDFLEVGQSKILRKLLLVRHRNRNRRLRGESSHF